MYNISDDAKAQGLAVFDTAIPQGWVDTIIEQRKYMKREGFIEETADEWPYGFVWSYDMSPIWGEPYPVTPEAKLFAKQMSIRPRIYDKFNLDNMGVPR